jgi:hypothetical protein
MSDVIKQKVKKQQIPMAVRNTLWDTFIGFELGIGVCFCCNTAQITQKNFEAGHIIAESKGGSSKLDNLRPVCKPCNGSMGVKNMAEFIEEWGFVKHKDWDGILKEVEEKEDEDEDKIIVYVDVKKGKSNKTCDVCDKEFPNPAKLKAHKDRKNPCVSSPKECEYCGKKFARQSGVTRHLKDNVCLQEKEEKYKEKTKENEIREEEKKKLEKKMELINKQKQLIDEQMKELLNKQTITVQNINGNLINNNNNNTQNTVNFIEE